MKRQILLFISASLWLMSCSKQHVNHHYIDQSVKDYYGFQKGSYWIFKDSLSQEIDSLVVTRYDLTTSSEKQARYGYLELYDLLDIRFAMYTGNTYKLWDMTLPYDGDVRMTYGYDTLKGDLEMIMHRPSSEYAQSSAYNCPDSLYTGGNGYASFFVDTIGYSNVQEVYRRLHANCLNVISRDDHFFITQDQGFIKIVLNNDLEQHVWELLRYNIAR